MQLTPTITAMSRVERAGAKLGKTDGKSRQPMEEVGTEFESVFASMLIKQMRESSASGMFEGDGSDTYGAMFDMFFGQHMAQAGGLGIKEMLVARYAENSTPLLPDSGDAAPAVDVPTGPSSSATAPVAGVTHDVKLTSVSRTPES